VLTGAGVWVCAGAQAKKETQIIALRGAEVEKELAAAHEDLESTRSMMVNPVQPVAAG
jgi:hypothetical protein